MLAILLLAAAAPVPLEAAQVAYLRCLSEEMDAAVRYGASADAFAAAVPGLCEAETHAYRAAAIDQLLAADGRDARDKAAYDAAAARFDAVDAANRQSAASTFAARLRMRRGQFRPTESGAPETP